MIRFFGFGLGYRAPEDSGATKDDDITKNDDASEDAEEPVQANAETHKKTDYIPIVPAETKQAAKEPKPPKQLESQTQPTDAYQPPAVELINLPNQQITEMPMYKDPNMFCVPGQFPQYPPYDPPNNGVSFHSNEHSMQNHQPMFTYPHGVDRLYVPQQNYNQPQYSFNSVQQHLYSPNNDTKIIYQDPRLVSQPQNPLNYWASIPMYQNQNNTSQQVPNYTNNIIDNLATQDEKGELTLNRHNYEFPNQNFSEDSNNQGPNTVNNTQPQGGKITNQDKKTRPKRPRINFVKSEGEFVEPRPCSSDLDPELPEVLPVADDFYLNRPDGDYRNPETGRTLRIKNGSGFEFSSETMEWIMSLPE